MSIYATITPTGGPPESDPADWLEALSSPIREPALLECMKEHQVPTDVHTHTPSDQSPIKVEGTNPLPEAQRDRSMARISMAYPDTCSEIDMLQIHHLVLDRRDVRAGGIASSVVRSVPAKAPVARDDQRPGRSRR
ncbi:AAA family ATPase [Arthrobacter zhaoguopingii]|uniref:AAA family ATPase n=1 Tax=Arthrobacter zhaoguopingii TaxID=2681491 RepID=UPI001357C12A